MLRSPLIAITFFIAGFIIILTPVLIFKYIYKEDKQPSIEDIKNAEDKIAQRTEELSKDQDQDGLKDWEETLWQTNESNPDTDGDGMSDGEEVSLGRSPTEKGVGTQETIKRLPEEKIVDSSKPTPVVTSKTETSPSTPAPSQSEEHAYGNILGAILKQHALNTQTKERSIFSSLDKNTTSLQTSGLVNDYSNLVTQLSSIVPPTSTKTLHQSLITAYLSQIKTLENLAISAQSSNIQTYNNAVIGAGKAFVDIAFFFKNKGEVFKSSEAGFIFSLPKE